MRSRRFRRLTPTLEALERIVPPSTDSSSGRRRFAPTLDRLEPILSLTPVFMNDPFRASQGLVGTWYTAQVYALALGGQVYGPGQERRDLQTSYGNDVAEMSKVADAPVYTEPRGSIDVLESGDVDISSQVPGNGDVTGPLALTQVTFLVNQTNRDTVTSTFPDMLSFASVDEHTYTRAVGESHMLIDNGGNGAKLAVHFHAHWDNTMTQQFTVDPSLDLHVGGLVDIHVIPDGGAIATTDDGIAEFDPLFAVYSDPEGEFNYDGEFDVTDGLFEVTFDSWLQSYENGSFMPQGDNTNWSHFSWTLTLSVSEPDPELPS